MDRDEFNAQRRSLQDKYASRLLPLVQAALDSQDWGRVNEEADAIYREVFGEDKGTFADGEPSPGSIQDFLKVVTETLAKATEDSDPEATALMIAVAAINAATADSAHQSGAEVEWVTMHDSKVRAAHEATDGQIRTVGEPFSVAGVDMPYPGWPGAPIELWINCRCSLRVIKSPELSSNRQPLGQTVPNHALGGTMEETQVLDAEQASDLAPVPWHGVLAPEGVKSGDGRMFALDSLRNRDLPLPLTWQKVSADGHNQNVTVAKIEKMEKIDGEVHASGHFLMSPEAGEAIDLLAEFGRYGVSIDADEAVAEYDDDEVLVFSDARISAACIVSIPAFAEAYVSLGSHPVLDAEDPSTDEPPAQDAEPAEGEFRDVGTDERKRRAADGTAMDDGSYPIANCGDLKNAIQAIGRAKDPEATKRHIRKRKSALDCPDVELPESWAIEDATEFTAEDFSDIEQFLDVAPGITEDGPGWLTHPVDTDRLRDYWVRGPGAAKIGWGAPGDFNRCRANLAKYVKPQYLSGYCANRHKDALGFWPGEHSLSAQTEIEGDAAPAISLAASGGWCAPSEWFVDPELKKPTSMSFNTDERGTEVWGHLAQWDVCHIGIDGVCTVAPPSASNYAYFMLGQVDTDAGPVRVGNLTIATGHAPLSMRARPAQAHYDDTGTVWADVAVGEDKFGIWYHGWVRPTATEEMLYAAKASGKVSGDWREIVRGSNELELVAALTVNVEGFQKLKPQVGILAGGQISLVAAGVVEPEQPSAKIKVNLGLSDQDKKDIAKAVATELAAQKTRRETMAALKEKAGI